MSSDAAHTTMTGASGDIATVTTPTSLPDTQDVISGHLNDIVVTHILRSQYFDDPADLARLRPVSRAMREAVAATELRFMEQYDYYHVWLGCLSAVMRLQRGVRLSHEVRLCEAAARTGKLEELKVLRKNDTPWNASTCLSAAKGGHLEVLQWVHANGCPWDEKNLACLMLFIATRKSDEVKVRALIETGADVNRSVVYRFATPLYIAARNGHEAVVRALLEGGGTSTSAGMTTTRTWEITTIATISRMRWLKTRHRCTSPLKTVTKR